MAAAPGTARKVVEIPLYAKRETIYQREAHGPWQRRRAVLLFLLAGFFLALPWVAWGGRQAVWFDLPTRRFHLFGLTFWPQDFIFLSWLLIIAAFSLFFFTTLAGRLWCGYACPQTVWTKFFMWIEWLTEGDRNARIRLDRGPWTATKVGRKAAKHAGWLLLATVVGVTFVGYFIPIRDLLPRILLLEVSRLEVLALFVACGALYVDAGWMREQICKFACPYARFQGAMFDDSTLTILYDRLRGEPRGRRRFDGKAAPAGRGDCIDCHLCVQVCPTGIDIRNGTQAECIGCAACIDACDTVMGEVGYPKGLVRYATEEGISGGQTRILRPRLVAYGAILLLMVTGFAVGLTQRLPLGVDVLRDRARLYRETGDGQVENVYTVKILNKGQEDHRFHIRAAGLSGLQLSAPGEILVAAGEVAAVPVRVRVDPQDLKAASVPVWFTVEAEGHPHLQAREESRFLAPAGRVGGAG